MTNLSLSWIEQDRWAALLVGAGLTDRRKAGAAPPAAIQRAAGARSAPPAAPPAPAPPPRDWEPPRGPLAERLAGLVVWVADLAHAESIFVSDDGGLPVYAPEDECPYLWVSANLHALLKGARTLVDTIPEGGVILSLLGDRRLYFVEATTPTGVFGLGFVSRELLDEGPLEQVRAGLRRAFAGE
jgi:hypothetical protein